MFASLMMLTQGCSEDDEQDVLTDTISSIEVFDVGNEFNGNDIFIKFKSKNPSARNYLIIVNQDEFTISANEVAGLNSDQVVDFSDDDNGRQTRLTGLTRDSQGGPLVEGKSYTIQVYIPESNDMSIPSSSFILREKPKLDGDYAGSWSDNLYSGFQVSMSLTGFGSTYSGQFFYSSTFTSCCGENSDGTIVFALDDQTISEYSMNQSVTDFFGAGGIFYPGVCTGSYEGSGRLLDPIKLQIDFTGEDCEGNHEGRVTFTRIVR
ncbi:MAG: hypothetical protein RIF33_02220 [Cyclobacteriaceae bacterium]